MLNGGSGRMYLNTKIKRNQIVNWFSLWRILQLSRTYIEY